jgi:hypothetical protein
LAWLLTLLEGDGGVWAAMSDSLATPVGPFVAVLAVIVVLRALLFWGRPAQKDHAIAGLVARWIGRGVTLESPTERRATAETEFATGAKECEQPTAHDAVASWRDSNELVLQAQTDALAGDRASAVELLFRAVELEPTNKAAWLWLAGVLEKPDQAIVCLEQVLLLDPGNPKAQQGLQDILDGSASRMGQSEGMRS